MGVVSGATLGVLVGVASGTTLGVSVGVASLVVTAGLLLTYLKAALRNIYRSPW